MLDSPTEPVTSVHTPPEDAPPVVVQDEPAAEAKINKPTTYLVFRGDAEGTTWSYLGTTETNNGRQDAIRRYFKDNGQLSSPGAPVVAVAQSSFQPMLEKSEIKTVTSLVDFQLGIGA